MEELERFIKGLPSFEMVSYEKALAGDLAALQYYSGRVGRTLTELSDPFIRSNTFVSLSHKEKALLVREQIAPMVTTANGAAADLSFGSVQEVLKRKGLLFAPAFAEDPTRRLKDIVAGGLKWIIDEDNIDAGANIFNAGFQQIVSDAPRSVILKTSEKVYEKTGSYLVAKRVTTSSNSCEFCRQLAGYPFRLNEKNWNGYHDFCNCRVIIQ